METKAAADPSAGRCARIIESVLSSPWGSPVLNSAACSGVSPARESRPTSSRFIASPAWSLPWASVLPSVGMASVRLTLASATWARYQPHPLPPSTRTARTAASARDATTHRCEEDPACAVRDELRPARGSRRGGRAPPASSSRGMADLLHPSAPADRASHIEPGQRASRAAPVSPAAGGPAARCSEHRRDDAAPLGCAPASGGRTGVAVSRSRQLQRLLPGAVLLGIVLTDLAIGRGQSLIGLLTMPPLLAATALGRRATVGYGVLALLAAIAVGLLDDQFTDARVVAQSIRLAGICLATALAMGACTLRLRREQRLSELRAQAAVNRAALRTAEALQRNLLGPAPVVAGLQTAVRYLPASRNAQVGGDWYDAFALPDGTTMLVIGDVAGHDAPAAAAMAQLRGMLRAIATSAADSPATALSTLDQVLADLDLHTLVTVTVATLEPGDDGSARLSWSNAGHPPAVLACADGEVTLLARTPERLLGVAPGVHRTDHQLVLHPGDTLLLYTDGLVERRGATLDDGFGWLVGEVEALGREPLEQLCDALLAALGGRVDDDVALLAVRLPDEETKR